MLYIIQIVNLTSAQQDGATTRMKSCMNKEVDLSLKTIFQIEYLEPKDTDYILTNIMVNLYNGRPATYNMPALDAMQNHFYAWKAWACLLEGLLTNV